MTKEQKVLLELVKITVSGECSFSETMLDTDWSMLFKLVCQQGMIGITWKSIETLYEREINDCPPKVKLQWYAAAQQQAKAVNEKRLQCLEFIQKLNIPCVVLKGIDYCRFWPEESWRGFEDLDIWPLGKYEDINKRAAAIGCSVEADGYYKHCEILFKGLVIENHQFLTCFDGTKSGNRLEKKLQSLIKNTHSKIPGSKYLYSPSADFTALFMLLHAHQHFFYEGITLRQILDWCFFIRKEEFNVNWQELTDILEKAGIIDFYNLMNAFCVKYFGLKHDIQTTQNKALLDSFTSEIFANIIEGNKFLHLTKRFKRMWTFRTFLGSNIILRIVNTIRYNCLNKTPVLK